MRNFLGRIPGLSEMEPRQLAWTLACACAEAIALVAALIVPSSLPFAISIFAVAHFLACLEGYSLAATGVGASGAVALGLASGAGFPLAAIAALAAAACGIYARARRARVSVDTAEALDALISIGAYKRMMERIAALTERLEGNGEGFGERIESLKRAIEAFSERSGAIFVSSLALGPRVEDSRARLDGLAEAADMIRGSLESQASIAQNNESAQREMRSYLLALDGRVEEAKAINRRMRDDVRRGREEISEAFGIIQDFDRYQRESKSIMTTIGDVADRIRVLSINAAIEATRAGVHGKGFSVVAKEIRKLAAETTAMVEAIEGRIAGINGSIGTGIEALRKAESSLAGLSSGVEESSPIMEHVVFSMDSIKAKERELIEGGERMAQDIQAIKASASRQSETVACYHETFSGFKAYLVELMSTIDGMRDQVESSMNSFEGLDTLRKENARMFEAISRTATLEGL